MCISTLDIYYTLRVFLGEAGMAGVQKEEQECLGSGYIPDNMEQKNTLFIQE